ncbi:efflux RND transporter permease subunit, partial [Staphylococcus epidermidis]|uniref:efflux RND transporter permease subunit n=1 Tax=Staphylococcus epidermidis TaxID=1282 RepID=UPI0011A322D5
NTLQLPKQLHKKVHQFLPNHTPIKSIKTIHTPKPIEHSLYTILQNTPLHTILAVIVILLFLTNITTTAISILSIPISILIPLIPL